MMKKMRLTALTSRAVARKSALGVTQADEEAMRNKGGGRTLEKRELLRRTEARAKAAGLKPITSHR